MGRKQRRGASRIGRIAGEALRPPPAPPTRFFLKIRPSPCWEVDDDDDDNHDHNNHNHNHNHNHNQHHNRHNRNNLLKYR